MSTHARPGFVLITHRGISVRIKECPPSGGGVHQWAYGAGLTLRAAGFTAEEAEAVLDEHATRPLTPNDYPPRDLSTVRKATPRTGAKYDPAKLQRFAEKAAGFGAEDLKRKSPVPPGSVTPTGFLRAISQPGEMRLVFTDYESQGQAVWTCPPPGAPEIPAPHEFIRSSLRKGTWFTINPVDGTWRELPRRVTRHNPTGRTRRAEENLTGFPFILLESDLAPPGLWIAALAQMRLPIAAIYTSGGRSIHALVKTGACNKAQWEAFRARKEASLVTLGADPAALSAVRLSRLPGCYRGEKQAWQELLYLNPAPCSGAIIDKPDRREAAQPEAQTAL